MKKVMVVFGTRPEAIKMCPLVMELKGRKNLQTVVCVTGQHQEMLEAVLETFQVVPDYNLSIMKKNQTLFDITTLILNRIKEVIEKEMPDMVLIHGDTTTTFAGSLAAFYQQVKVGHVEAGLRTFNKYFPFPEEMNRKLTGALADMHFSPTTAAKSNLLREGVNESSIFITGNTVIDAFQYTVADNYCFSESALNKIDFENHRVITVTAHRRENLGQPLNNICSAIKKLAEEYRDVIFVYPVHLNPAVREVVFSILTDIENVKLIDPIDVLDMHNLLARSLMVMTDSGGLQEEAPHFGKPVLVLRTETERPEAVEAGTVKVVGVEDNTIYQAAKKLLDNEEEYNKMAKAVNPYGDGHASERIVEAILQVR